MKRIFIFAIAALIFTSCDNNDDSTEIQPVENAKTTITFDARVGNADFALNKDFTIGTRTYNFSKLRYWVSNVTLIDSKGAEYLIPDSYYLMEEVGDLNLSGTISDKLTYPARKRESIDVEDIPAGEYKSIKFSIGVDSKHNDNLSLQSGELSIANGMSNIAWMWHTSYIFSSVAGIVKEGTTSADFLAETGLNANYKTVSIDFAAPVNFSTAKGVVLNLDVTKIVDGIDLIKTPKVNAAQAEVMSALATNYGSKAMTFGSIAN
ncbi:hypothetical protein SAMN04487995_3877 [Dyadobacter koreensis]|uniref:Copper-binding protein MbnP-like domain-containing protein n=1 Tax=Dyadobacter koreensis TaxID=408657 RepID=A0A1H6XQD0_9BACT|nr:MbnP family protein [Dyadobacter koreensis]SEJ27092.1 hypothetical protein SAMN04487995_3877 [Dyadobacter koreensis]